MCLLLSFSCCRSCSSASSKQTKTKTKTKTKKSKQPEQAPKQQDQPIQEQQPTSTPTPINYHSDLQLNDLSRSDFHMTNSQGINDSMCSLPISMSLSLMPLPHPMTNSSTLSSWAAEEELYDMEEYEARTPTRWTAWWLHGASASDLNLRGFDI